MRHRDSTSPIWKIRQTGEATAYYRYLKLPAPLRKQYFTFCLNSVKEEDENARVWRDFFQVLIDHNRDELEKMAGSLDMLRKSFNWSLYKKWQREAQRRKKRRV